MLSPERFQEIFDRVIELVYDNDAITVREIRVKLQSEFGDDARAFEREVAGINTLLNDIEETGGGRRDGHQARRKAG